jgi:Domain of unknown function (DUF4157)
MLAPPVSKLETKMRASPRPRWLRGVSTLIGARLGDGFQRRADRFTKWAPTRENANLGSGGDDCSYAIFPPDRSRPPQALVRRDGVIQPKLVVGPIDDPLENEADRVADHVMRTIDPELGIETKPKGKCACGGTLGPTGECAECRKKRLSLQPSDRHPTREIRGVPPIVHAALRSSGQPLDTGTRAFMETRFGHDFSRVRVHADATAAESARLVAAQAYTVGSHVVFGGGQFAPTTPAGKVLLAHELVHTLQQAGAVSHSLQRRVVCPPGVSPEEGTGCYETDEPEEVPAASPISSPDQDAQGSTLPEQTPDSSVPPTAPLDQTNEETVPLPFSSPDQDAQGSALPEQTPDSSVPPTVPPDQTSEQALVPAGDLDAKYKACEDTSKEWRDDCSWQGKAVCGVTGILLGKKLPFDKDFSKLGVGLACLYVWEKGCKSTMNHNLAYCAQKRDALKQGLPPPGHPWVLGTLGDPWPD